ncbi:MAG TPA: branched-chain amino acid aminotransferase [Deltaproteobacteria bacterium]|nr:branched-chain amino acid aminotransferase [Deltaproteobacteria bacterium]
MEITIHPVTPERRKPKPVDESALGFGKIFTDHMFVMHHDAERGWHDPSIVPYGPFSLDPGTMCFHYGQEIFEGMKAYRGENDNLFMFRPEKNIARMNQSAERLCMPPVDPDFFMEALKTLIRVEKDWIPHGRGTSLYIRPTMIATEVALGVHPSNAYLFFIILSPVGAYYPEGFNPTRIYVSDSFVRACPGGVGNCKAAGNYAASLYASTEASNQGYTQVLWLDALTRTCPEEVGTSNIFFVLDGTLVTPPLGGTILPGVMRDSIMRLARSWDMNVEERRLSMDDLIESLNTGRLTEVFASGTAAVVSPVGLIRYRDRDHEINGGSVGPVTRRLYDEILKIQYGEGDDPFEWRARIDP